MNRNEFMKRAAIALGGITIAGINSNDNEELEFIKSYMEKYVDFTDIPEDLNLAEKALTAYIHGQLSKTAAVKILMITDDYTESEAISEIENLHYEDGEKFTGIIQEASNEEIDEGIHVPYGFAD